MSLRAIGSGLRRLFARNQVEADLRDEVAQYLELAIDEHMRAGMSRAQATRRARIDFGGVESAKEGVRSAGWEGAVESLWRDTLHGVRSLRRNPGFTIVALLTIALGIGANTAMFSVVNAVILRPLPYRNPSRIALIWTDDLRRGLHQEGTAFRTIEDWRATSHAFQSLAFYSAGRVVLTDSSGREHSRNAFVSANVFSTLGVSPLRGRALTASDESNAEHVAVISYALWQRRFGGDDRAVGKTLQIGDAGAKGGGLLRIVGVMPSDFYFPDRQTEIWTPATTYWRFVRESSERFPGWARRWTAVGRLKPEVSTADARADLNRVGTRLGQVYQPTVPDFPGFTTNVVPILDSVAGTNLQSALWILLGAVALVLLVACANVANLLLARGASRQREFAIRRALGAGRGRLARQLLIESMVLAIGGGLLGILLAAYGTRLLSAVAASQLPRMEEVTVDWRVLVFAGVASVIAGIVFGVVPAARVSAADASQALKEGGRATGGVGARRTRGLLVVAQCSLAIVLLTGAGLLLRSLGQLRGVNPGYEPSGVLTVRVEFPAEPTQSLLERQQPRPDPARARSREQVMHESMVRVAAIPGVQSVGFVDDMFITGQGNESITIPGRPSESFGAGELSEGDVTPDFFSTMRVPVRRGRALTREDGETKIRALWGPLNTGATLAEKESRAIPEPVVVNEAFVRRFFATEDPIGKRFCVDPTNKTYWYVIVGVVGDMRRQGLERRAIPEYFGAYFPSPSGRADLAIRTRGNPLAMAPAVRRALAVSIPGVLVGAISTADRELGNFTAQRDFQTWLLAAFAALALALAAVGIYGVVHYTVAERTQEVGVRIALGASARDVMRLIIGQGMRTPVIGIAIGLAAAFVATRLIAHLLFGVEATDPVTFAAVAIVLAMVAAAACYFPARRATRVDPIKTLRSE